jgi:hypothetical protein
MKKYLLLLSFVIFLPVLTFSQDNNSNISCDSSLWQHVYKAYRLEVIEECKTVTGTINLIRKEKDGDLHIQLKLDKGQGYLLNKKNKTRQKGCLVLEPVCIGKVTQQSALGYCDDYVNKVYIPEVGEHVRVTGSYVLDTEAGHGWREIHPVTKIEVIK